MEALVLCAGMGLCALCIPMPQAGLVVLLLSFAVARWAEVSMGPWMRMLLGALGFAVVSLLPQAVAFGPGLHPAFDPDGFRRGLLAGTRAAGTLSVTLLLVFSVPFPRIVMVLRRCGVPALFLDLLALVHRQIFLLDETLTRLRRGLACRGGWGGARIGLRSVSMLAASLFVHALERARRQEAGLLSRGSEDGDPLFLQEDFPVSRQALGMALVLPALLFLLLWGTRNAF